jgi:phage shock protein A
MGYEASEEISIVLDRAEKGIFDILQKRNSRGVTHIKHVLEDSFNRLEELYQRRIDLIKQNAQLQRKIAQKTTHRPAVSELEIDTSAVDAYDRMVDRVRTMEAQAEALAELAEMDEVEEKFRRCAAFSAKRLPERNLDELVAMVGNLEDVPDVSKLVHLLAA